MKEPYMNKVLSKKTSFSNLLISFLGAAFLLLFISCEGYINAKATSQEIEKSIEYANAQTYSIFVKDTEDCGVIKAPAGGEALKKVTDTFTINYGPFDDYDFLYWKIIDETTKHEYSNGEYLTITSITDKETQCTFTKAPKPGMKLCLVPVISERPESNLKSPEYVTNGVNWDSRILVMFDKDMDPCSIYYTQKEYKAKKEELGITDEDVIDTKDDIDNYDNVFLCLDKTQTERQYYGYKKDGIVYFKNIQITRYDNSSNLLQYFNPPQFDDPKRLSIYPKKDENNIPLIPNNISVSVTLDKNFCSSVKIPNDEEKPVSMRKSLNWHYFLNDSRDNTPPSITGGTIDLQDVFGKSLSVDSTKPSYLNSQKKLKFKFALTDEESGMASSFALLLKKTGSQEEPSQVTVKYQKAEGFMASCGSNTEYYECSIPNIKEEGDYQFNLQFYDNAGNATNPSATYYVSIDTKAPVVKHESLSPCNDTTNSEKTAIKLEYSSSDQHFAGGELWCRTAVPTTDAAWNNWNQTPDCQLDKAETSKTINGLDFGTTYEFKAVYYDEAGNATNPYYFKRTTNPQAYNSSWLTITPFEDARCIKISTNIKPAGANITKLIYTTGEFGVNQKTNTYETSTTNDFFIRDIEYAKTYKIKIVTENSEVIDDNRYTNYLPAYTYKNTVETELTEQKTKPQGVTVTVGEPVFVSNDNKFKYKFTVKGKKTNLTGVKYKYGYYDGGILVYPTDNSYSGTIDPTGNSIEFSLEQEITLAPSKRYHFVFESYYDSQENVCDQITKKEFDFWTPPLGVTQSTFKCETNAMTTAKLTWQKPDGDFSHYKIVWYKSLEENNKFEAYVPKDETSFTITNLLSDTYYKASIFCYSYKNECCGQENSAGTVSFKTKNTVSDEPFRINKIRIDTNINDYNIKIYINYSPSFVGFSGSFEKVTVKWVEQQSSSESYEALLNRFKSTNNKGEFSSESSYVTMNISNSNSNKTYYLRFFDPNNNEPVSDVFAVRPKFSGGTNRVYYLQEFSYDIQSENRILLHINWDNYLSSNPIKKIRWKKTGETQANWKSMNFTSSAQNSDTYLADSSKPFTPGSTFDVEFCNDNGSVVYAAAFITIPSTQKNAFASNLTASKWSYDSITLTWEQNADCDYYNVYKQNTLDSVLVADQINKESPSVTIRGLTSNTYYSFIVVCHKSGIEDTITSGDWTNYNTKSIRQNTNDKKIYINSVIQSGGGSTNIQLKFNGVEQSKGMKIYYKAESETDWNSKTISNSSSYTITSLTPGLRYDIKVAALSNEINNVVQESFPATCVAYTKPNTPSFTSSGTGKNFIKAYWTFPTQGKWAKALLSYSKKADGEYIPLKVIDYINKDLSDSKYYTLDNLEPGTTYYFKLTCYADEAMSEDYSTYSGRKSITTNTQ